MNKINIHRRKLLICSGVIGLVLGKEQILAQTSKPEVLGDDPLARSTSDSELAINYEKAQRIVREVLQGRPAREGLIDATVPDIAEDGSSVPASFTVNCSMTNNDYPKTVHVIGMVNPTPEIARYHFTPACGEASVVLRCRMHASSELTFVANMADGTVGMTRRFVSVTAGGCI